MEALFVSFGVIFVAELGDKSQLMALTFATRFRALQILAGIAIATALVYAMSVFVGAVLGAALPTRALAIAGGLAFFAFALWTLHGDHLDDDETSTAERATGSAIVAASSAFFLAELGDKTMLATIALAASHGVFGTWLGSTLGMVAADALAIGVGQIIGARLPERPVRIGATVLFFVFGTLLMFEGIRG